MPYHVGEKGSYGCSGYPAVKDDGTVMGCHKTKEEAANQIYAINQSEGNIKPEKMKARKRIDSFMGDPEPASYDESHFHWGNAQDRTKAKQLGNVFKADEEVEKACWDGYTQRGMKPANDGSGRMVPNCVPTEKADDLWEDDDTVIYEDDNMEKADGYSPPAGARSAARKAIKFKEDGKATGAGTAVGWTRARQLANGETLSLSTVKRMYSYFSRHEVDKKGKDWGSQSNPSKGYVMWLAWGGDAGFTWSRNIVEKNKEKSMFADFAKDHTKAQQLSTIFKSEDNDEDDMMKECTCDGEGTCKSCMASEKPSEDM